VAATIYEILCAFSKSSCSIRKCNHLVKRHHPVLLAIISCKDMNLDLMKTLGFRLNFQATEVE